MENNTQEIKNDLSQIIEKNQEAEFKINEIKKDGN